MDTRQWLFSAFLGHWWGLKRERREVADGGDRDAVKERLMAVYEPENKGRVACGCWRSAGSRR
jgi:hypothetical protein